MATRISFYHVGVINKYEMTSFLESGPKMNLDKALRALKELEEDERVRLYPTERLAIVRADRTVRRGERVAYAARV